MRADIVTARQGDGAAAHRLVERFTPFVAAIVRAHLPHGTSVDDQVQEAFLRMFAGLHSYVPLPGRPFSSWLARLTVNCCRDAHRAAAVRPRLTLGPAAQVALLSLVDGGPDEDAAGARELVAALLDALSPDDRAVLTLVDLRGFGTAEAARHLGISRIAVKVRTFRARRRLRAIAMEWRKDGRA